MHPPAAARRLAPLLCLLLAGAVACEALTPPKFARCVFTASGAQKLPLLTSPQCCLHSCLAATPTLNSRGSVLFRARVRCRSLLQQDGEDVSNYLDIDIVSDDLDIDIVSDDLDMIDMGDGGDLDIDMGGTTGTTDVTTDTDEGDYVVITNPCGGTVTVTADYYLNSAQDYYECSEDAQDSQRCVETLTTDPPQGGTAYSTSTWPTSGPVYIRVSELVPTGNGLGSNRRAVPLNDLEEAQLADGSSGYKASDPLAQHTRCLPAPRSPDAGPV